MQCVTQRTAARYGAIVVVPAMAVVVSSIGVGPGCDVNRGPTLVFQKQRLHQQSFARVFAAARDAMARRFPIESSDSKTGVIRSRPVPARLGPAAGRLISESIGWRTGRRVAEIRVLPDGDDVELFCRVLIQQLETDSYVALERQRGAYDQPTDTPADQDAALTPEQNAVWINRGRDRQAERALLDAINAALGVGPMPNAADTPQAKKPQVPT